MRMHKHRKRYALVGSTWGRILFVILEKVNSEYFVITARDATEREKRRYKMKLEVEIWVKL